MIIAVYYIKSIELTMFFPKYVFSSEQLQQNLANWAITSVINGREHLHHPNRHYKFNSRIKWLHRSFQRIQLHMDNNQTCPVKQTNKKSLTQNCRNYHIVLDLLWFTPCMVWHRTLQRKNWDSKMELREGRGTCSPPQEGNSTTGRWQGRNQAKEWSRTTRIPSPRKFEGRR